MYVETRREGIAKPKTRSSLQSTEYSRPTLHTRVDSHAGGLVAPRTETEHSCVHGRQDAWMYRIYPRALLGFLRTQQARLPFLVFHSLKSRDIAVENREQAPPPRRKHETNHF